MKNGDKSANIVIDFYDEKPIGIAEFGLTKREAFSMAAMQGLCSVHIPGSPISHQDLAIKAVACADELLKQLEK